MKVAFMAIVATAILSSVSASTRIPITHDPVTELWDSQGNPLNQISFLPNRWLSASLDELEFRKRSSPSPSPSPSHNSTHKQHHASNAHPHPHPHPHSRHHWKHDPNFGVIIAKAENDYADNEFLVNVQFGTPRKRRKPQILKVVFDSGSPDTWVYGPLCCYANNHTFFNPTKSTTFRNRTLSSHSQHAHPIPAPPGTPGQPFFASYANNRSSISGYVGLDSFTLQDGKFTIPNLPIAITTSMVGSRAQRSMQGLLGLSPGNVSEVPGKWTTPFEALAKRAQLDKNYLSATLVKANRKTGRGGGGQYVFGEIDRSRKASKVVWTKVISAYFWGAYFDSASISNITLATTPPTEQRPNRFIVDTGTAYISMPPLLAKQANQAIANSIHLTNNTKLALSHLIPCDTGLKHYEKTLQKHQRNHPLIITINSTQLSIPIKDLVLFPHLPIPPSLIAGRKNMCYSAIQDGPAQLTVLGLSFIKNHVLVLDQGTRNLENRRIGFAKRSDVKYDL